MADRQVRFKAGSWSPHDDGDTEVVAAAPWRSAPRPAAGVLFGCALRP